eukprot:gene8549-9422_t
MRSLKFALLCFLVCLHRLHGTGVTSTPQMGWNSWNKFACNISETLIKETADALVSSGLSALGYDFVNLDDCWQAASRDSSGRVQADAERFPSGLQALGEYLHSKGLKFGIYSSAGFRTCQGYPASLGVEAVDAQAYADWGVDYLKYDNCYQDHGVPQSRYSAMANALEGVDREIFYSLCEWGRENVAAWASRIGAQSWRISGDIRDKWSSIKSRAEIGASLWRYSGPGVGWNDPDMLEIGNGGCSQDEYLTHFSLWAVLKAPLIIGNDIRTLSADSAIFSILSNKEVIAVNQDLLGRQARLTWSDVSQEYLPKNTDYGSRLIATQCASGQLGAYEDSPSRQEWEITSEGFIQNPAANLCLHEHDALLSSKVAYLGDHFKFADGVRSVSAVPCDQATKWSVEMFQGGSIVSQSSGLCLEVESFEFLPITQGKRIQTSRCQKQVNVRENQSWARPRGSSLLNLYQRQCLTIDEDAFPGLEQEVWTGPLSDNALVVLLVNKGPAPKKMELTLDKLGSFAADGLKKFKARDLWKQKNVMEPLSQEQSLTFLVPSHGSVLLKLTPQ